MMKKIVRAAVIAALSIYCAFTLAQTTAPQSTKSTNKNHLYESLFNVQDANRTLDKLTIKLSIQNLNVKNLHDAVTTLTTLQDQAKECVDRAQSEMDKNKHLWQESKPEISPETKKAINLTSVQEYLQEKRNELRQRRSECRLFALRSGEAISAFSKTAEKLSKENLLKPEPSFWAKLVANTQLTKQLHEKFDSTLFLTYSGIQHFNKVSLMLIGILILLVLIISLKLRSFISSTIPKELPQSFAEQFKLTITTTAKRYIVPSLLTIAFAIFITIFSIITQQFSYIALLSYSFVTFVLALTLIHFFFFPSQDHDAIIGITVKTAKLLTIRLKLLITLCFVGGVVYLTFYNQLLPETITDLPRTVFITLLTINLISILWLVNRLPKLLYQHKILRFIISSLLTIALMLMLVLEWLGYQQLVTFILTRIALTLIFGFLAILLVKILVASIELLGGYKAEWQTKLRAYLNLRPYQAVPELIWLRVLVHILIWGTLIIASLKVWGLSTTHFRELMTFLMNGFKTAGLDIIPSRILSAFVFFILASFLIRWIRAALEHKHGEHIEKGSQQALAAIMGYISFAVALILALIIAGVNFAGLAIIAGALSVGIGFGLQNIVNNFVSGIILLVERPIKPGDRILVGDTEGFVKKISIRSTQIQTLQYSDLIVPNAEMISSKVTNLMFKDFYGRIAVEVGVAYGSDVDLVRKILLEAAKNHPEVISEEGPYQPIILFKEFGNSSLNFALYCIIRNINLKFIVTSDLNFEINKAFKEHGITIPFPQRDIHIKDWKK